MYYIYDTRKREKMKKTPTLEQQKIIETTEGNIRVGAVPGSGKTYVLTNRIAYLIQELYVEPSSIVAMTFTNKAAGEMKRRLQDMIGDLATCFMGTFHGFCNLFLKEEIHRISYPKTFVILDKRAQIDLIREVAEENQISLKDLKAKDMVDRIAQKKLDTSYLSVLLPMDQQLLKRMTEGVTCQEEIVYYHYLKKQRDNYALDFQDMIQMTLYILLEHKDVLEKWQKKCQYVLCDEYQDVNNAQDLLLSLLSGKYHNLTVVGDDDQCIYGWRGSEVDYMVDFEKTHEETMDFTLSENFRSTPEIIAVANSLISKNANRLLKTMFTNNPAGKKPVYYVAETLKEEADFIAEKIKEVKTDFIAEKIKETKTDSNAVTNSGVKVDFDIETPKKTKIKKYSDYAILVRASSQTRALEEAFIRKKIPYKILSGAQFYGSEEIKTVLSYLRLVYSLNDLDFMWAISHPRRGFGKKSMEELKRYAFEKGITLMDALGEKIAKGLITKKQIVFFYESVMQLHKTHAEYWAKDLAAKVLELGYRETLEQDVEQAKIDNVTELLHTIAALEKENIEPLPLEDLLAHFALFSSQDDDDGKNVVKIMTIHTAKGLEFPTVFIPGMVDGQFPSKRLRNRDELEEERRLFYVAITRAKEELYISSYRYKTEGFPTWFSSFMEDIDYPLLEHLGTKHSVKPKEEQPLLEKASFQLGDKVIHPAFGEGIVEQVNKQGQYYEIFFPKLNSTRQIVFRAKLQKMD